MQVWHGAEATPSPVSWTCNPTGLDTGQVDDQWPGPERRRRSEIWVFARHEGADISTGWTFRVVPLWWLNKFDYRKVNLAKLSDWRPVGTAALADTIREALSRHP
jgi:hypothetical protein